MANEETEMNFVRCWNCRSLVPSSATRCRMCGSALSEGQGSAAPEAPVEEAGERRSRIRQKTLSIPESAVQSIKASAAAGTPPPLARPQLGPVVTPQPPVEPTRVVPSASQSAATGTSVVIPSSFRFGGQDEGSGMPERTEQAAPAAPSLSVTARALRELEEESAERDEVEVDLVDETFDDQGDIEITDRDEANYDLGPTVEGQSKKRKRRRRKKKKAGLQPGVVSPTGDAPVSIPHNAMSRQESVAPSAQEPEIESHVMQSQSPVRPEARIETNRAPAHSTPRTSPHAVETNRKRVECPAGGLIGWFINYDKDKGGVATEIRCGRFFICGERLKESDLVLEHATLSTPHCLVKANSQEGLKIQDLMSEHGTFIKRRGETEFRRQHETAAVYHGDILKFGEYEVMVCLIEFPYAD